LSSTVVSLLGSLALARGGGSFEYYVDSTITETHLVDAAVRQSWLLRLAREDSAMHCTFRRRSG